MIYTIQLQSYHIIIKKTKQTSPSPSPQKKQINPISNSQNSKYTSLLYIKPIKLIKNHIKISIFYFIFYLFIFNYL